jgi:hypothetical protein
MTASTVMPKSSGIAGSANQSRSYQDQWVDRRPDCKWHVLRGNTHYCKNPNRKPGSNLCTFGDCSGLWVDPQA